MALQYTVIEIFTSEHVRWQGKLLYEAVVEHINRLKLAARCIVLRGIAGCYENGEVATQKILDVSYHMPLKIEIILPTAELHRVLPDIEEMVMDGIVVVEEQEVRLHKTNRRLLPNRLLVRDVMTPSPISVVSATPVGDVIRLLLASVFHGVPVVDNEGHVIGIITQNDLISRAGMSVRLGILARLERDQVNAHLDGLSDKMAQDIMSKPATVVQADMALSKAVDVMLQKELKRLPVVDEEGHLVGMLSRVDIFRTVTQEIPDVKTLETHHIIVNNVRFVRDIMRRDAHTVLPQTPIQDVIQIIDDSDVQRVAVVDGDGKFLGLVFDHDLLALFSAHPQGLWDYFICKLPFVEVGRRYRELAERMQARTAADVMQRDITTVQEDTPIEDAIRLMVEKGFKRIPVVSADGVFSGMISRDAVLRLGFSA